jgi:hypothetical protein
MQDCQLAVYKPNPRQYVATISQVGGVPVTRFVAGIFFLCGSLQHIDS